MINRNESRLIAREKRNRARVADQRRRTSPSPLRSKERKVSPDVNPGKKHP